MSKLLIVDDDPVWLCVFRDLFDGHGITLVTASSAAAGLEAIVNARPDVILLDINLPDISGLDAFCQFREANDRIPIIFVTAQGDTNTAIKAMQKGAHDYVLKDGLLEPQERGQLVELVERAFNIGKLMNALESTEAEAILAEPEDVLIGRGPAMQDVYKAIGRVAAQDITVLIQGESGTGKELVARALYQHSRRTSGPFLAINCAAIPEALLESELFGHEKGAFTGADRKRIGKFEQCNGGTIFLDEIGDMTPLTQTKILRVLQEQRFERVGGNETIQTDVRLIAATHRNLGELVEDGQFRSDLFYRLSVFTIRLPPLRERRGDLALLIEYFRKRFNRELGKDVRRVSPDSLDLLSAYRWPGNLRELQSTLKQSLLLTTGPDLLPEFLPENVRGGTKPVPVPTVSGFPYMLQFIKDRLRAGSQSVYSEVLETIERLLLTEILTYTDGNQVQAAKILGITRNSLRFKMRSLDLQVERSIGSTHAQPE